MKHSGFTLIELIVSLTIITVLAGMILAGYARFHQRQSLVSAGQNFKNILTDAQSRAVSSEVDCSICGGCTTSTSSDFKGWYVDFTNKAIYGKCGSEIFPSPGKPFGLSPEITIVPRLTPPVGLLFNYSPSGTSGITPSQNVSICVSQTNLDNLYYVIRISKAGVISDENLLPTCP